MSISGLEARVHAHISLDGAAVDVVDDDGRVVLVVSGPCDGSTAGRVLQLAEAVRDEDALVLDLAGVTAGRAHVVSLLRRELGSALVVRE